MLHATPAFHHSQPHDKGMNTVMSNPASYLQLVSSTDDLVNEQPLLRSESGRGAGSLAGNASGTTPGFGRPEAAGDTTPPRISRHLDQQITGIFQGTPGHIYGTLMRYLPGIPSEAGAGEPAAWSIGGCSDPSLITITCTEREEADITVYCLIGATTVNETSVAFVPAAAPGSVWFRSKREELVQRRCQEFAALATIILLRHAYATERRAAQTLIPGSTVRLVQ